MTRHQGFTLIELMITVSVIVVLALLAAPAYREMMLRAYRGEAQAGLQVAAAAIERCYSEQLTYVDCPVPASTESGLYRIEVDAESLTDIGYTLVAVRDNQRVLADARCGDFTLNSIGLKGNLNGEESCW